MSFHFFKKPQTPELRPSEAELRSWACSSWVEYQAWLFHHSFVTLHTWREMRAAALQRGKNNSPVISVLTPVYNTPPDYLRACIYSVQTQAYPFWEMCLVDDGCDAPETLQLLNELSVADPRLRVLKLPQNQGICSATNHALASARGDYIAFLDHDDRLAPDALFHVAEHLCAEPATDIIYTDRDMLSPNELRFMHLCKPGWSPETLLSGNYLFHLLVYRRTLAQKIGGLRPEFEGSQDYDLILRAADKQPKVHHIPKILYHWRQHKQSVSLEHEAKAYAYDAGIRALQDTLHRRCLFGTVSENSKLWRGNYRIQLEPPNPLSYYVVHISDIEKYCETVNTALEGLNEDVLIILGEDTAPLSEEDLKELTTWLSLPGVILAGGKVLDMDGNILHAGLVQRKNGIPLSLYLGHPEDTPGYMAVTANLRNVGAPHPLCCAVSVEALKQHGGLSKRYHGPHALLDFALDLHAKEQRSIYNPFARFHADDAWHSAEQWPVQDRIHFAQRHKAWLENGDPYYSPWLTLELEDMGLDLTPPSFSSSDKA